MYGVTESFLRGRSFKILEQQTRDSTIFDLNREKNIPLFDPKGKGKEGKEGKIVVAIHPPPSIKRRGIIDVQPQL